MHAIASMRLPRILTLIILAFSLSACGEGDGPQSIAGTPATELPPIPPGFCDAINFEILCPAVGILNFNGGQTSVIDNPEINGINTSAKVAQMQKFPDDPALLFGGTRLDLDAPIDFSAGEAFKVKVWSPRSVRMIFKLEEADNPNGGAPLELSHTGSGAWEELCYDFTGRTGSLPAIPALTIIFDDGVAGAADTDPANWTFYYDDIEQVESCGTGGGGGGNGGSTDTLPFDFEGEASAYDFGADGGFEGGAASVIDNPQSNGINISAQVGQMLKFTGAVFGGSTLSLDPVTLAEGSSFTMKVWSQRAVPVQFQLEPYNAPFFTSVIMHNGSGWEELTFPFPTFSGEVSGITLIFDPAVAGAAATDAINWTFYFDDITLVPPSGGGGGGGSSGDIAINGGFETGDFSGWETFPGGGLQAVVTDNPSSGTFAANLTVPVRVVGDPAVDNLLKNSNLEAGNLTPGDTITVSFDMRGSLSGAGGVVFAELFSELSGGGTSKAEILSGGPLSPTADWTSYSYTTTLGDDVSGGVTLQLKASCGPVVGCGVDIFVDNVTIVAGSGGGTGGSGGSTDTLPFDFEGEASAYDFGVDGGFEGGAASVIVNPQSNGINTSAQVGQMLKFDGAVFGGSTLSLDPVTLAEGSSFTMKVWSQRAVPVQFQLEPYNAPFFTSVVDHGGTGWEELTFPFPTFSGEISGITLIFDPAIAGAAATDAINWTFYFDDITLIPPSGGGGGSSGDIAINGGFESGDFSGWETFPGGGTQAVVTDNPSSGTFAANLTVPVRVVGDPAVDNLLKNSNLEAGNLTPGDTITVSFDMRGSLSGAGGVVFAELFSELSGGGTSKAEILSGGPLSPTADWTTYSYTTTLGDDVSGGVTLQLKASCGPVVDCGVDVFFDNVTIVTGSGGGTGGGGTGGGGTGGGSAGDIAINGGFETGDLSGWETFPGGGTQTISTVNPSSGTFSVNLTVPVRLAGDPPVDNLLKNANLEAGNLTPGDTITVSFDMRGSLSGAGGVVFAELFSELSGGGTSKAEILSGGPLSPTADWTTYSYTTTLGDDVSGGVTLQLKASCGPVVGCGVDIFIDNVSIVTGSGGGTGGGTGSANDTLPFDFEGEASAYDFGVDGGFEGGAASVIANPQSNGINTSAQVGQMLKFDGAVFGGSTLSLDPVTLAEGSSFTMKVWSQRAVPVQFQLEPYNAPFFTSVIMHNGSGWEELTFLFPTFSGEISGITLIFDPAVAGAAATDAINWTFYFDDMTLIPPSGGGGGTGGGGSSGDIAINGGFETGDFSGWETFPGGGLQAVVTDNPSSGTFSANLTVPVRVAGDPPVDNLLKNANLEAGNLTPGDTITVSFDMRGSLSGDGGVVFAELFSELSGGGTSKAEIFSGGPLSPTADWTTYSYTTTLGDDVSGGVTLQLKASCGPVVGCGVDVFMDNVIIVAGSGGTGGGGTGGGGTGSSYPDISFDDAGTTYTLTGFNGAEGSFVTNDPAGGVNMVVQVDRSAAATGSAGTIISTGANFSIGELPLDAQNTQLTVRVYAPAADIPVRLKIENSNDANVSVETETLTTVGGAWETLTFNFLNEVPGTTPFDPAATYDKVTIFFNFGTDGATAGAQTFYFDDIAVLPGTGGGGAGVELVVNGNFESGDLTAWDVITMNGGSINLTSPGSGSGSAVTIDASGGPFNASLKQANLAAGQLTPGQEITISLDWKGMAATGGVVDVVLFSESGSGISQTDQILDGGAFPADWTTVGPMTLNIGPDVSAGLTLQVTVICGAESACLSNVSLDNISIIAALSNTGGGAPDTVLVTFDEPTPPAVTVFGGATATIAAGPAGGDGTNALQITRDGGQDFAGAYWIVPEIAGAPGMHTVSALVYSPTAGIPMPARLAINSSVGTGDVQANETVVVGWQTLTWSFTDLDTAAVYPRFAILPNSGTIDTAANYFFDNITLVGGGGSGGSGGGSGGAIGDGTGSCGGAGELAMNCDFETGDLFGWTEFSNGGLIEVVETGGSTSVYAAHLVAAETQNPLIKQFEIAAGAVMPGASVTISFDMKGSLSGDGGVVFAELFSEGDPTTGEILTGGPIFPTATWVTYSFTPSAGVDVTRGITFQLAAVCGAVAGCGVDVFFDNVSIKIN